MTASDDDLKARQQVCDWLFARMGGERTSELPPDEAVSVDTEGGECESTTVSDPAPTAVPEIRGPEDLRVASEWLRKERERLDAYTRRQLATLQQQHQALVSQNYRNEQTLILRSQELARKEELLLAQGRTLHQQGEELSAREQALAGQLSQWRDAQEELAHIRQVNEQVRGETETHRSLLATLQAETAYLEQSKQTARAELDALMSAAEARREARTREEAMVRGKQTQLEQRLAEADGTARACQRRLAELDDLEANLRREFEEQEQKMTRERQELDALREATKREKTRLAARLAELDRRQAAAEEAERTEQRRQREMDALQERLEDCVAGLAEQQSELERREWELELRERHFREESQERVGEPAGYGGSRGR